ncbi:methylaspartate ammonia-lyase [Actinacidiphila oryziradicis]|uniref:methylaspartate ammonia-lyase n=1 Tax=Actinacidiphila oryziradicis TaxID=2571141 RepID=UPI0023F1A361|nr:methylaspartate ammonia-lyase [Actinacidiphila oryziradicis]MCW2869214.1 methylaspartate ammonia-lyase [Actinacidiphila oryziradicis]
MFITDVLCVPVRTGFFTDDQAAIRAGTTHDGFTYAGEPVTPGFRSIRQAGEAVSVMLLLDDGQVAHGDCAAVQYSGVGGRDTVFDAAKAVEEIEHHVVPLLRGREIDGFRSLATEVDTLAVQGRRLHTAIRYGVTQALLDAAAKARSVTMAEVIRDEYDTGIEIAPVPMFVQTGDDRYNNVDKMVLKEADVLPHGLINHVETKLGRDGELLAEYVTWVRDRIVALRTRPEYEPVLHFDVYGTVGAEFDGDVERVADYLAGLGERARPFRLRVEHVIDAGSRDGQVTSSAALRAALRRRGSEVQIAVDEWCNTLEDIQIFVTAGAADVIHVKTPDLGGVNNTIEALLLVARDGLAAYCGGTCNETDRSAQVSAQIAMACGAAQVLAKPGMGVDEGMMIVGNEMARVAALAGARGRAAAMSSAGGAA